MTRKKIWQLFLAVFFFAMLLIGCNSGGKKERIFLVARDITFTPLNLLGKENNLLGFTDELIYRIAMEENFRVDLENTARDEMFEDLEEGHYDAVVSFVRPSLRQQLRYDMSAPFFMIGPIVIVSEDADIENYQELSNKIVGITKGLQIAFDQRIDSSIVFTPYENILFALRNLASGQIDAVIMKAPSAIEYISSFYPGQLKVLWPPLTDEGLRLFALKKNANDELITLFDSGLEKLKANGTYKALLTKWGLYDPSVIEEIDRLRTQ